MIVSNHFEVLATPYNSNLKFLGPMPGLGESQNTAGPARVTAVTAADHCD